MIRRSIDFFVCHVYLQYSLVRVSCFDSLGVVCAGFATCGASDMVVSWDSSSKALQLRSDLPATEPGCSATRKWSLNTASTRCYLPQSSSVAETAVVIHRG